MVNWTVGPRNVLPLARPPGRRGGADGAGRWSTRLACSASTSAASSDRFVFLEDLPPACRFAAQGLAAAAGAASPGARSRWSATDETAVILFTSGSESLPKAVPLTHANILCQHPRHARGDATSCRRHRLVGILPPFHSFGLTVTTLLPLCAGVPVVYYPNPTEAAAIARVLEAYRPTILVGRADLPDGIVRVADGRPARRRCDSSSPAPRSAPRASTTCSKTAPAGDSPRGLRHNGVLADRVGQRHAQAGPRHHRQAVAVARDRRRVSETLERAERGERGDAARARAERLRRIPELRRRVALRGVRRQALVPHGRPGDGGRGRRADLRRPAQALHQARRRDDQPAGHRGRARAVLRRRARTGPRSRWRRAGTRSRRRSSSFTTLDLDRETANGQVRAAGLSGLYAIRRVVRLEAMPVLGTGKTDYRRLREML